MRADGLTIKIPPEVRAVVVTLAAVVVALAVVVVTRS
jgi:hypothetical protein